MTDSTTAFTFWMVMDPIHGAPKVAHETKELAEKEATRLALRNPGCRFYVLEAIGAFQTALPQVLYVNTVKQPVAEKEQS